MPYLIGNAVTLSTTITVGTPPVATDPSTITLVVTKPDSTTDTFTGGQLVHGGTGAYSLVYLPATAGAYRYVWTTTVPASASDGTFYVAASSAAIVTAGEVRAHLNLTDATQDVELQGFISAAQAVIENRTGPVIPVSYTETLEITGSRAMIVLTEWPVLSIASVAENTGGTAYPLAEVAAPYGDLTGYAYRADYSIGTLTRWSGNQSSKWAQGLVTVTYTAGRASVPPDIRLAALRLIEHLWTSQQNSGRLRGGSLDIPAAGHAIPWFVEELLQPHAKPPAVG